MFIDKSTNFISNNLLIIFPFFSSGKVKR